MWPPGTQLCRLPHLSCTWQFLSHQRRPNVTGTNVNTTEPHRLLLPLARNPLRASLAAAITALPAMWQPALLKKSEVATYSEVAVSNLLLDSYLG